MANLSNIITPTNVLTANSTNTVTNKTIAYSRRSSLSWWPALRGFWGKSLRSLTG